MKVVLTPAARRDLTDINRFTRDVWGKQQSKQYISNIYAQLRRLERYPHLGVLREILGGTYRVLHAGSHLVLYEVEASEVVVLRVIHERAAPDFDCKE